MRVMNSIIITARIETRSKDNRKARSNNAWLK